LPLGSGQLPVQHTNSNLIGQKPKHSIKCYL